MSDNIREYLLLSDFASGFRFIKVFPPLVFAETGQYKIFADNQRALDQHAVGSKQGDLFVFAELRQFVF